MQRSWVMAVLVASGLLAQTPPPEPAPAPPVQAPEPKPADPKPEPPKVEAPAPAAPKAEPTPFEQLRPSQRKLAYHLWRAALSAHELGYHQSHPRAVEARDALAALVQAKAELPEKHQGAATAAAALLGQIRANHGLYDGAGKKLTYGGAWKDLMAAAKAAGKTGPKGLEARLGRLKGLLTDPKVDATAPGWAEPEPPAKGRKAKAKAPKAPEGFSQQKAITALWMKRAQGWIENTTQEVEVKGEKKVRRLPDPVQTKALADLVAWLEKDDLDLLRDAAFPRLDLRRLGTTPCANLMKGAADIATSKAPEGAPAELVLLPQLLPVLGESKFSKGEEKRQVLTEVKLGPAPASLEVQMGTFEQLGRSREFEVK